ncbi:hypothetical protein Y032_0001g101 [Ancylostoma ceylanicum]|uniref:Uncharacterized protein n=1 Tax=Ancylostoma ceylanicum TaxID=53326 RepID=A0A016W2I1_9BILA|nr:hypothetical protein Y032_0001g101 [Ancylostoma ceylanicum]
MNIGMLLWNEKWCFHQIFCAYSKAYFFFFLHIHFYSDLPTFIVIFQGESKCTHPPKFVLNCFVDSNSIAR